MYCTRPIRFISTAAFACAASMAGNANAQEAGSTTIGAGWLHIMPQAHSDQTSIQSVAGAPVNQDIPDSQARAGVANTFSLMVEHHFTDNVGLAFLAGGPFTQDLVGQQAYGKYGVIGKTKPMAPILELRYHLFSADAKFRPFVGVGVNYTWFKDTRLSNDQFVMDSCGPGCTTQASLSTSWNPTFDVGASYAITKHWSIGASLTYIPLSTTLTVDAQTATGVHIVTKTKIKTNPLITLINVAYTF